MPLENPKLIRVKDSDVRLNTDFRNWIKITKLFDDTDLQIEEQRALQFRLAFREFEKISGRIARDPVAYYDAMMKFLRLMEEPDESKQDAEPVFDFVEDWEYIAAAFMEQYQIDIKAIEYMHWFDFLGRFRALSGDTLFKQIVGIRAADLNEYKGKQKAELARLKNVYKLQKVKDAIARDAEEWADFEKQMDIKNFQKSGTLKGAKVSKTEKIPDSGESAINAQSEESATDEENESVETPDDGGEE